VPEPPAQPAPPTIEELPIIPFKPPDPEPVSRVRVVAAAEALDERDFAEELALVIQKEVAEGNAVVVDENSLEELVIVEDDGDAGQRPPMGKALADVVSAWVKALAPRVEAAVSALRATAAAARPKVAATRAKLAAARARAAAASVGAPSPRRDALQPPPSLSELPVLRLARVDTAAANVYPGKSVLSALRPWAKRGAMVAGLAAVGLVVAATSSVWMPLLEQLVSSRIGKPSAAVLAPVPSPTIDPRLPREVLAAIEQMPHLAPETVQLVVSTSPFAGPEPPEVFRRARAALRRGASSLTPEEAQQLAVLERAVLARLRPIERERVQAYDRVSVGRDLLSAEDARVLGLFVRGARGLSAENRARLQALSGKAIAAALDPGGRPTASAGP
jgi:hypothetical protein